MQATTEPIIANSTSPAQLKPQQRLHLSYLDGLRALAALYVVNAHVFQYLEIGIHNEHLEPNFSALPFKYHIISLFTFAHQAVVVFIVLSGYCLMLPVVRSGGVLKGGFFNYIKRRALRILPGYYATLALGFLLYGLGRVIPKFDIQPYEAPAVWLSHLLMVHNLIPSHVFGINGPLWTVATEWQIYFLFPLFLIPLWREGAAIATLVGGALLSFLLWNFIPAIEGATPYFLMCFALGMVGAAVNFDARYAQLRDKLPWGAMAVLPALAGYYLYNYVPGFSWDGNLGKDHMLPYPLTDILFGFACVCVLIGCTRQLQNETPKSAMLRFLSWEPLVWIGSFSYSIYLVHMYFVLLVGKLVVHFVTSPSLAYPLIATGVYSCTFVVGLIFYRLFEKPFMQMREKSRN